MDGIVFNDFFNGMLNILKMCIHVCLNLYNVCLVPIDARRGHQIPDGVRDNY